MLFPYEDSALGFEQLQRSKDFLSRFFGINDAQAKSRMSFL